MPFRASFYKPSVLLFFCVLLSGSGFSQAILPGKKSDASFPVTNKYDAVYLPYDNVVDNEWSSAFNIVSSQSKYYVLGNFTNVTTNTGGSLVLDTTTHSIQSDPKWRINGLVRVAVGDGQGGFYIGGSFTSVGDSGRSYIAHIDGHGSPLVWPLQVDGVVNALYRRNDTLFIGGAFSKCNGVMKPNFAMYSLSADSLFSAGGFSQFIFMTQINCFLIQHDTLIYGGQVYGDNLGIRKYNFKDNVWLPWKGQAQYQSFDELQFNADSSVLVCRSEYNGQYILGLDNQTGSQRYSMTLPVFSFYPEQPHLRVVGNKAYLIGRMDNLSSTTRQGMMTWDATAGASYNDDLQVNGYVNFIDTGGGNLYLSGKFTSVRGVARENFAVLDAATLTVKDWDLTPTDDLTAIAFSGPNVFCSGYFTGIHAQRRNGLVVIDSVTHAVLGSNPVIDRFREGRRLILRGDSVFVLGITARPSACQAGDYNASFSIYSASTGAKLLSAGNMDDFTIDGDYLYASESHQIRRYHLPEMVQDAGWGMDWTGAGGEHTPTWLIVTADKIYTVGDNRFSLECTTLVDRTGYVVVYDKATGLFTNFYSYKGLNPPYDQMTFEHALLIGNKLYIQGYFNSLNQQPRVDFACVDVRTGAITDWKPPFITPQMQGSFNITSELKYFNGYIWFGSQEYPKPTPGVVVMDTITGKSISPGFLSVAQEAEGITATYTKFQGVSDVLINDNGLVMAGGFDTVRNEGRTSLAKYSISISAASVTLCESSSGSVQTDLAGVGYQWQINKGDGFISLAADSVFSGVSTATLSVTHVPFAYNGWQVRCLADGHSGKVFDLAISPALVPAATISAPATSVCKGDTLSFTAMAANGGTSPTFHWLVNNTDVGVSGPVYTSSGLNDRDSVRAVLVSNAGCLVMTTDTSAAVVIHVNSVLVPVVTISGAPAAGACSGDTLRFRADTLHVGAGPVYDWKRNGVSTRTFNPIFVSNQLADGDSITLTLTSVAKCVIPKTVTSNAIRVSLSPVLHPSLTIRGDTVVASGASAQLTAATQSAGANSGLQWQDSTEAQGWKDISGANEPTLTYSPDKNGAAIRCLLHVPANCASPALDTSNVLRLRHPGSTAGNDQPRLYPNPVKDMLTVSGLSATASQEPLVICDIDGRQAMIVTVPGGSVQLSVPVAGLPKGIHYVILLGSDGSRHYLKFLKL